MSTSTSTNLTPAELLPPPPQVVAGGPTAVQRMDSDTTQFGKLLNIIGGKKKKRRTRRHPRHSRRTRHSRKTRRRSRRNRRHSHSYNHRRRTHRGGTGSQPLNPALVVSTPPEAYPSKSVPDPNTIIVKVAGITAQNNANAHLDNPQKTS